MSATGIPELNESRRRLGGRIFWLLVAGLCVYLALTVWLTLGAAWPRDCHPFDGSHGRGGRLIMTYLCSPRLFAGGAFEYATLLLVYAPVLLLLGLLARNLLASGGRTILAPPTKSDPE